MNLDLQSELYAPTGNISGRGVERSLGTPTLDRLQLLVRETGQNAWDARESDEHPVLLRIRIRTLAVSQKNKLWEMLSELPSAGPNRDQLLQSVGRAEVCAIEIADYNTTGLRGPVRADLAPVGDEAPDFINFFRNIGSPRDKHLGGGTYGYGKSSVFTPSRCRTIVGYTQTTSGGERVVRLMAASVGEPFEYRKKRFTGRHWWGSRARDGVVDPLEKEKAQRAAVSIGLQRRDAGDSGTTLMILDPNLESRSLSQTANAIAECLAWFFWPKMLDQANGVPAMRFEVELEGNPVEVPGPSNCPPLGLFADAMGAAKGAEPTLIRCERPIKVLGRLGFARGPVMPRIAIDTGNEVPLVPPRCCHVALMRPTELVVRYLVGPVMPSDFVEYGGVFVCNEEVEPAFAAAEPPAHDDWVPDNLEGHSRTFVRVALRRISESIERYANPLPGEGKSTQQQSLAILGDALGGVLIGQRGSRHGPSDRHPRPNLAPRTSRTVIISDPEPFRFAVVRKTPCALFRVKISGRSNRALGFRAKPFVVLEGGSAPDAAGLESPKVIAWLGGDGDQLSVGPKVDMRVIGDMAAIVAVSIPGDCAIGVDVELEGSA